MLESALLVESCPEDEASEEVLSLRWGPMSSRSWGGAGPWRAQLSAPLGLVPAIALARASLENHDEGNPSPPGALNPSGALTHSLTHTHLITRIHTRTELDPQDASLGIR